MKVRMQLMSDAIFGNGESIPGGEDISVLSDKNGFPYYKGGTFKGIFREELGNYLAWTMRDANQVKAEISRLLGTGGDDNTKNPDKLVFSDFTLSDYVRRQILSEIGTGKKTVVLDALSHIRTFTALTPEGIVKEGSLRQCRCINKGLNFYGEIKCLPKDERLVEEILSIVKWVGTMRSKGFGKVKLTASRKDWREDILCQNI